MSYSYCNLSKSDRSIILDLAVSIDDPHMSVDEPQAESLSRLSQRRYVDLVAHGQDTAAVLRDEGARWVIDSIHSGLWRSSAITRDEVADWHSAYALLYRSGLLWSKPSSREIMPGGQYGRYYLGDDLADEDAIIREHVCRIYSVSDPREALEWADQVPERVDVLDDYPDIDEPARNLWRKCLLRADELTHAWGTDSHSMGLFGDQSWTGRDLEDEL